MRARHPGRWSLVLLLALYGQAFPQFSVATSFPAGTFRAAAVTFTDVAAGLINLQGSSATWGDYDNDGDLDLLLAGTDGGLGVFTKLYRNNGGLDPTFTEIAAGLMGIFWGAVAWGDYDNDGDLDIVLTGYNGGPVSKVYRNNGGASPTFTDMGAGLVNVSDSAVGWGDYDNDGDLDILLSGWTGSVSLTKVYRNDAGIFTDVGAALEGVSSSSVAWGDYDKDGDLDIVLAGTPSGGAPISRLYRNNGGASPTFTDVGAGLTGAYVSSVAWGDYDNDGDLDILLSGSTGAVAFAKVYRNAGGSNPTFTDVGAALPAIYTSSVAWGDYDNDGDLDIALTGRFWDGTPISAVYASSGGANPTFSDIGAGLTGVFTSSAAWGDYDNDDDLDILLTGSTGTAGVTKLYRNSGASPNTVPGAPGGLAAAPAPSGITLSWSAPSDPQTPAAGLTYNLRVGTTPGGSQIQAPMATSGGYRRVARLGSANQDLSWRLRLPDGTYYWSVQAVDGAFAGSPFATEQSFQVAAFTDAGAGMTGVYNSSVAWGDYDNDGDLDVLLTGFNGAANIARLYRNSGGATPTFSDVGAGLTGVQQGSVAWGDYDNDGDLDILLTGFGATGPIARLYRNSGGANPTFTDVGAGLAGVQQSSVAWGDYDNDGDLDILLTGSDAGFLAITKLYRNSGGANPTFADVGAALDGVQESAVAWGDYDKDGDLDILLTGLTSGARVAKLYRNSGGASPTFSDVGAGLTSVQGSSVAWGDYDNDGDLDILLTGFTGTGRIAKVYRSSGGANPTFTDVGAALDGVNSSSVAWGDYDNDGDLDILLTGFTGTSRITKLYQSSGGANPTFGNTGVALTNVQRSSVAWGDYDNDGDLDILLTGYDTGNAPTSRLYRSNSAPPNTPPNSPGGLNATSAPTGTTTFTWAAASDAQTPSATLTYNLRVGTTPGGNEISSAMAAGTGYRRVVQLGNVQERLSWTLRLPPGAYYWSVQALDGAFAGSPFAAEQTLLIGGFIDAGVTLSGASWSSGAWGDYDNDGDLDILLAGDDFDPVSKVYRNDGAGAFTDIGAGLTGVSEASAAWGDYDNDGALDILLAGADVNFNPVSKVYRNDGGGSFIDIGAALTPVRLSAAAWGDYDNDGDLDVLLTGATVSIRITKLYRNDGGGVFSDIAANLTPISQGSVAWGDYDNDGDLDIALAGVADDTPTRVTKLYRNEGNGAFTDILVPIPGLSSASIAWGDFDNDGDLDLVVSGNTSTGLNPYSRVFRNDGSGFFTGDMFSFITSVFRSSVACGDYDNDGDLDILLAGANSNDQPLSRLYRNDGTGVFFDSGTSLTAVKYASVAWGDYDNDGDLDFLLMGQDSSSHDVAKVYRNAGRPANAAPVAPGNLSAVRNGGLVTFGWTPASDDHTPPLGLTYNLRVGTSPGGDQRVPAMAGPSGYRRVPRFGNAQKRTSWTVALPPGPYYWSVQAIDGSFQGSPFATATVAVEEAQELPATFDLDAPAPNPFAANVSLGFALPLASDVEVAVFDLAGRRLRILERGHRPAGRHRVRWDGRSEFGTQLGNGIYLVRMTAAGSRWTRKLVLSR